MKTEKYFSQSCAAARAALVLPVLLALLFTACAEQGEPAEPVTEEPIEEPMMEEPTGAMAGGVYLDVAEQAPYGQYLTDEEGRALYLFTADTQGQSSACYDACAEAWPPLLTEGDSVNAASAVDTTMIGTIERTGGSMQVTYNGWPLYYFQQDTSAGMVEGQDVHGFGGEWYLISPQGQQIEAEGEGG